MNCLFVLSLVSTHHIVFTLRHFRYHLLNRSRLSLSVSHWDYDIEPFAVQHHSQYDIAKYDKSSNFGKLTNYSLEADGTTICIFVSLEDKKSTENRFVCVLGAECCDSDGCCFTPNPGDTLRAVSLFFLSILGCVLLICLCLVFKSKSEREKENQLVTARLLSHRVASFELVSLPGRRPYARSLSSE